MARPRKKLEDRRTRVLSVRLTSAEYARVDDMAKAAGMLSGPYARETILNKRPRSRPVNHILLTNLIYELGAIAKNFNQLADATGDELYIDWAKYVGGTLVSQVYGRDDLGELIETQIDEINAAGHMVNSLARTANGGGEIKTEDRRFTLNAIRAALASLDEASSKPAPRKKSRHSKSEEPPAKSPPDAMPSDDE